MPPQSAHVIHPLVVDLGFIEITGFGIAMLMAFMISAYVLERELTRRGHAAYAANVADIVVAAFLGTAIGGKIYYAVLTGDVGSLWRRDGLVFWGGFIGAVALCYLAIRRKKHSFLRYGDVAGIAIAAGYAVGRTGCWLVGDDYGRRWDGPLAVTFPNGTPPSTAGNMRTLFGATDIPADMPADALVAVHPTQLYETAMGFLMFVALWRLRGHRRAEGWLLGLYGVLAGAERFAVEFFRAKDDRFFGALTAAQLIALAIAAIGAALMYARRQPEHRAPTGVARA